jgi:hypothetical protein
MVPLTQANVVLLFPLSEIFLIAPLMSPSMRCSATQSAATADPLHVDDVGR